MKKEKIMKILYIHSTNNDYEFYNDYMNDLFLHGLRELYGNNVMIILDVGIYTTMKLIKENSRKKDFG